MDEGEGEAQSQAVPGYRAIDGVGVASGKFWSDIPELHAAMLDRVARALAATDPDRAERIAQSITDRKSKTSPLVKIAEAWSRG